MAIKQFGTIYVWKGAPGGDWFDNDHNWTPGYPVAGPPGYGDLAIFNNGIADVITGNGAASELDVVLGTTLTVQDSVSTDGAITGVGVMVDSGGRFVVGSGATKSGVPSAGDVSVDVIGFNGAGAFDVFAGGGIDNTGLVLGDRVSGSGTLTVEGTVIVAPAAAPNGQLIIGNAGSGAVSVRNGGSLSAVIGSVLGLQPGAHGTATVTGNGSSWFSTSLTVGQNGTGAVTVEDGGVLTTFNTAIGAGGTLDVTSTLLGNAGTVLAINTIAMTGGTLDVSQGGIVVVSSAVSTGPTSTVLIDAGHVFTGLGTLNGDVAVSNQGALLATGVAPGVLALSIKGSISGGGTIEPLMTLDLHGAVAPTVQIVFHAPTLVEPGILILEDAAAEDGTISGFAQGNEIQIPGGSFTHAVFGQGSLSNPGTLVLSGGTASPLSLLVAGNYGATDFLATSDNSGTTVTLVPCFAAGTRISTSEGEVPVERLKSGMHLWTDRDGLLPIRWIGHRHVDCGRHADPRQVWPVRVRAGAFGPGLPRRDLWISPDHAIFVHDVLIPVKHLINRTSIIQVPSAQVTYYHVELPRHAIMLAEGLTVESYLDTGDRHRFANGGAPAPAHPDIPARVWEMEACAELVQSGEKQRAVRLMLDRRAAGPWPVSATRRPAQGRPSPQRQMVLP